MQRTFLAWAAGLAYVGAVGWLAWSLAEWVEVLGALVLLLGVLGGIAMLHFLQLLTPARAEPSGPLPNAYGPLGKQRVGGDYKTVPPGGDPYS